MATPPQHDPQAQAWDGPTKARALEIAEEHGSAEASRRTGVPQGTIRFWRHKAAKAGPPEGGDSEVWSDRATRLSRASFATAVRALADVRRQLDAGKSTNAKSASIAVGVLIDQTAKLERIAAEMSKREAAIAEAQAQTLAEVIRCVLEDVGVPQDGALRGVIRHYLLQAGDDGTLVGPAPDAEQAKREVTEHVGRRYLAELGEREPPREPLALPPPRPHPDQRDEEDSEQMIAPVKKIQALRERRKRKRKRDDGEEVEGEVVPNVPNEPPTPEEVQAAIHNDDRYWERHS